MTAFAAIGTIRLVTVLLLATSAAGAQPAPYEWINPNNWPNNYPGHPGGDALARPVFVYGAGADFDLGKRFFLRAQYRGLVYNSPTFDLLQALTYDRVTHRAEPSIGFGYRF